MLASPFTYFALEHFPAYIKIFTLSFASFTLLQCVISPAISPLVIGRKKWQALGKRSQGGWCALPTRILGTTEA